MAYKAFHNKNKNDIVEDIKQIIEINERNNFNKTNDSSYKNLIEEIKKYIRDECGQPFYF